MFSTIKNYIILFFLILCILFSGLYLWQRVTVVQQKAKIEKVTAENVELKEQAKINKKNIADAKALAAEYQKLKNETSKIRNELMKLEQGKKCLGEDDEKVFTYITRLFNDKRVRSDDGGNPAE